MQHVTEDLGDRPWVGAFPGGLGVLIAVPNPDATVRLASAGSDHTIRLWDLRLGATVGEPIVGHATAVWALTSWIDVNGRVRLASSAEDDGIRIWDPDTGAEVGGPLLGHVGWVSTLANWRTEAGHRLASGGFDGTIRIWDPDTATELGHPLLGHTGPVLKLFHWQDADGNKLASTSDDGTIRIWDADRGMALGEPLPGRGPGMWGLTGWTTTAGQVRLAAAGTDGCIQVWDPRARTTVGRPMDGHTGAVGALTAWHTGDAARLASLGSDGTIRFWDPESGAPVGGPVPGSSGWLPTIASWVEADGSVRLACGSAGGGIRVWDFATGKDIVAPLTGHTSSMWALTSWPTRDGGSRLAAGGDDAVVRVWNADTGSTVGVPLAGHTAGIWALTSWIAEDGGGRLASAGDDSVIRVWDTDVGEPVGQPLTGHTGWITALVSWTADNGRTRLASAGVDGSIRLWDIETGEMSGSPLLGGDGRVLALAIAHAGDGRQWLASGGTAQVVRFWDVDAGVPAGDPLSGHTAAVRGLTGWTRADGSVRFASASFDGTVRIWDPHRPACVAELRGHTAQVARVISWSDRQGRTVLASASDDCSIRIWDADSAALARSPLTGHTAGVWALTQWTANDGRTVLASTGEDGTVRLWDPVSGRTVRTIEVGPITLWGLSDAPTRIDVLGRRVLAEAVADQLRSSNGDGATGPMVVSVEGPWGCGKTTFMELVRDRLARPASPAETGAVGSLSAARAQPPRRAAPFGRLTVRQAVAEIRAHDKMGGRSHLRPHASGDLSGSGIVTAWFNPWTHESGEEVWAGLVHEIIEAAAGVLFPDDATRERYWFAKNLARVDRFALRRSLLRRIISPLLGVALAAVVIPLAIAVAQLNHDFTVAGLRLTAAGVGLAVALGFLLLGTVHTGIQYSRHPAANYLPGEMLHRPVQDSVAISGFDGSTDVVPDPLHRARAGPLYLHQHDIGELLTDLSAAGYLMVIFIDDIDRCRMATTAQVFEAVNIFLSSLTTRVSLQVRFVIGLDPAVVADHLTANIQGKRVQSLNPIRDNGVGWAYLRKLIQLPVMMPRIADAGIEAFVDQAIGVVPGPSRSSRPAPDATTPPTAPAALTPQRSAAGAPTTRAASTPVTGLPASERSGAGDRQAPDEVLVWRTLEQHPEVRGFIVSRLVAQPNRSIRDAKRLLNVWQLNERVLSVTHPITDTAHRIERAKYLVLLAEIVTRWPNLQSCLHTRHSGGRGLEILAAAATDDSRWLDAATAVIGDHSADGQAVSELRRMLVEHDGHAIARLAAELH